MLVLTRRTNEKILINGDIEIQILGHWGNQVRIGITAPLDVAIDREEIHQSKKVKLDKETHHEGQLM